MTHTIAEAWSEKKLIVIAVCDADIPKQVWLFGNAGFKLFMGVFFTSAHADADLSTTHNFPFTCKQLNTESPISSVGDFEQALIEKECTLQDEIDIFDPTGEALVTCCEYFTRIESFCGRIRLRTCQSLNPPKWTELEDKCSVVPILEKSDPTFRCAIISSDELEYLGKTCLSMDAGEGVVVSPGFCDNSAQIANSGCDSVFYANSQDSVTEIHTILKQYKSYRAARVMPFISGIPVCLTTVVSHESVYTVAADELLAFRSSNSIKFTYFGVASTWVPSEEAWAQLETYANILGCLLRSELNFAGVFNVQGQWDGKKFTAFEINQRIPGPRNRPIFNYELFILDTLLRTGVPLDLCHNTIRSKILEAWHNSRGLYTTIPAREVVQNVTFDW
eukprot:CAMPEP_0183790264 /NCGR_PEP_ID=MMETSP0803_2-20130417/906_1 /TAXON_ID=195967 /ORGANISM="Crustomastix stigmata, Strain CCMP3273" /LENGTH=390 /DNA_ID=CAMNT_0026034467 /DNA_START=242 /DNA_END=1411 /DNA_ORIENTATION=-